ncbi:MAG: hypothetical protein MUE83_11260 [Tabrizicola sp.]|jgi:hypothetical protein|nr:hypothetical protein [Tabrizicola sp.]
MALLRIGITLALLGWSQAALAQDAGEASPLEEAMGNNPDRFAARVSDLIAGFGGPEGLTAAGIEEHIALERAGARATALRRMLAMDLDADGSLDRAELAVSQRAASAAARGRMERQFRAADADGDGRIDAGELAAEGQAAGQRALGEDEAQMLRSLLTLDRDGNAALTQDEVAAAVAILDEAT